MPAYIDDGENAVPALQESTSITLRDELTQIVKTLEEAGKLVQAAKESLGVGMNRLPLDPEREAKLASVPRPASIAAQVSTITKLTADVRAELRSLVNKL